MGSTDEVVSGTCAECNGTGVRQLRGNDVDQRAYEPCPRCWGYGSAPSDPPARPRDRSAWAMAVMMVLIALVAVVVVVHV